MSLPEQSLRAALEVYDAGHHRGMRFDAIIGTPETLRIAHHRQARGVYELVADDDTRQASLWEVRTYVRVEQVDGWARYEPEGWQLFDEPEVQRRRVMSGR